MRPETMNCRECDKELHPERVKLGYDVCVDCSYEERCGFIHLFEGKSGNTIQVIKDPKKAAELQWNQTRRNFSVANGMYRNYAWERIFRKP